MSIILNVLPAKPALVVFDFDGVMTDDAVYIGEDEREWVRCERGDGMGISELRKHGIPLLVLSTEKNSVVAARCKKLCLECMQGCDDKAATLKKILDERGLPADRIVYVGNDINDIACLGMVGCGIAVADAHPRVLAVADAVLTRPGGHGAVRELCDLIVQKTTGTMATTSGMAPLTRQERYERNREYIEREGLDHLIDFQINNDFKEGVFDAVSGRLATPFPPDPADLSRLHQLIRKRMSFTVLEFGVGYSTLVIADALRKNQHDWDGLKHKPAIRNRFMFQLFSVDSSKSWVKHAQRLIPQDLADRVHLHYTEVHIGTHNGQLCHFCDCLPDIIPDFIYCDGPGVKDVQGEIRGLSFQCDERTTMPADLLLMESTFLPGTFILVDGRTNNTRFLQRNFTRTYIVRHHRQDDVTTFELNEERLGKYNILGSDFF